MQLPSSSTWTKSETLIESKCTAYGLIQKVDGAVGSESCGVSNDRELQWLQATALHRGSRTSQTDMSAGSVGES